MNKEEIQKIKNIIKELFYEELFHDKEEITQWQYQLLETIVNMVLIKVKNSFNLTNINNNFKHEIIEKIRNSKSDAEARRIIYDNSQ